MDILYQNSLLTFTLLDLIVAIYVIGPQFFWRRGLSTFSKPNSWHRGRESFIYVPKKEWRHLMIWHSIIDTF